MANNKLREALVCAIQALDIAARNTRGETGMVVGSCYSEAARKCRAALAEPVRNCDIGTLEDRREQFKQFCKSHSDGVVCNRDCPLFKLHINGYSCHFEWGELPFESEV